MIVKGVRATANAIKGGNGGQATRQATKEAMGVSQNATKGQSMEASQTAQAATPHHEDVP